MRFYSISIIGGGNVAFRLSIALQKAGHSIISVCNRDVSKAEQIIRAVKRYKGNPQLIERIDQLPESDIILICVSDCAIAEIINKLDKCNSMVLHTSGATSIDVFNENKINNFGVLYPLMTLSKNKDLNINIVPFLIEYSNNNVKEALINIVNSFKAEYKISDSSDRLKMHTAAVFATNFVNYMLSLSYDISSPDFVFLLPSVIESVRKAFLNTPTVSQTGPAIRKDITTINKHLDYLRDNDLNDEREVYEFITKRIIDKYSKNE